MSKLMVKEIQLGQQIQADFLIKDVEVATTKKNTQYLRCTLNDKSGSIKAVMWDLMPGQIPISGDIYCVTGTSSEYQGNPQLKVDLFSARTSVTDEDFGSTTQYSVTEMWAKVCQYIDNMESYHIKTVAADLMLNQGFDEGFKTSPAATYMHHAFTGGLLEHTSQICEIAEKIFELPFMAETLNKDLCMFGIIFHDFGKMFEYSHDAGFKKTTQGILVPHIPMVGAMIYETANKFGVPEVVRDHLMHVVLAHHGRIEHGSPVDMAIPEAAFVHHLDNFHGDIFGWVQKIATNAQGPHFKIFSRTLVTKRFSEVLKECETSSTTDTLPSS